MELDLTSGALKKEYVYGAGGLLATIDPATGTRYTTSDHLGSPRVVTDSDGDPVSRHDYKPFGEELGVGTSGRTAAQGYSQPNGVRKGFTGYEKDIETGLNYAQARYQSSGAGRFMSVDPYDVVLELQAAAEINPKKARAQFYAYLSQPQQWNRYAYVINNPLKYVDPTGEILWLTGTAEERKQALERIKKMVGEEAAKYLKTTEICTSVGTVTWVDYEHSGDELAAKGGELGVFISDLMDNSNVVEYRLAKEFDTKDGHYTTAYFGGAATVGREESTTGNTQIFVHPTLSSDIAQDRLGPGTLRGAMISSHGRGLDFYDDIVDAHEFGHAHANAVEGISLRRGETGSNGRANQLENYVRARRGMNYKRTGH